MRKFVCVLMCVMLFGSSIAMIGMGDVPVGNTPCATWNVPADFATINLAIAGAGPGDTITVDADTYTENVIVDKQLTIIGEDRETTIINGNFVDHVILITADGVNISGFHVMNAGNPNSTGMYVHGDNCNIFDNIATNNGAGIYLSSDFTNVTQNHVYNNFWVGIRLWGSSNNTVYDNNASFNKEGINLYNSDTRNNTIYGNTFFNNSRNGIYLASCINNTFYLNDVSYSNYSIFFDNVCSGNKFYHNNLMNANIGHEHDPAPAGNFYDNGLPDGGNYWDNYTGTDTDFDYIGDTLVPHPAAGFDQYPWVNVNGWDEQCEANDDNYPADEDSILNIAEPGVLANDTDPNTWDVLTVIEVNGSPANVSTQIILPSLALLNQSANGSFEYDPNGVFDYLAVGEFFDDNYTYMITDSNGTFDNATVFINVTGQNDAPTAVDDDGVGYVTDEDTDFTTGNVIDNDIDPDATDVLTVDSFDTTGTMGQVDDNGDGTFDYDPNGQFDYLAVSDVAYDTFDYTVSDENGGTDTAIVTILVNGVNDAPTITTTDVATATEDVLYSVNYDATDIDTGDTLTWSLETNGGWLSINSGSGVLSGTPVNADVGAYWVHVTVNDGNGGSDSTNFTLTVSNVNDAPVISTTTALDGTEGQEYSLQVNGTDADGDTLTWSLTSNATWLSINSTGGLSGTPTTAGTFWANVVADDGNGGTDSVNLTITIIASTQTDTDSDGDGVPDDQDDFPNDANETTDTDGDGTGDNADAFPSDSTEDTDTDGDGTGDNADAFPTDPAASVDTDGDGYPDDWNEGYTADDSTTGLVVDDDDDNDGILDVDDENPLTPDGDGLPIWIIIIIILVIVGIIGAVAFMKMSTGKGREPTPKEEAPSNETEVPEPEAKEGIDEV